MWLTLLSNKVVQITLFALLISLALLGLTVLAYHAGSDAQKAAQAKAQLELDNKLRLEDAKRYREAPINAGNAVTDKWLLQRAGR